MVLTGNNLKNFQRLKETFEQKIGGQLQAQNIDLISNLVSQIANATSILNMNGEATIEDGNMVIAIKDRNLVDQVSQRVRSLQSNLQEDAEHVETVMAGIHNLFEVLQNNGLLQQLYSNGYIKPEQVEYIKNMLPISRKLMADVIETIALTDVGQKSMVDTHGFVERLSNAARMNDIVGVQNLLSVASSTVLTVGGQQHNVGMMTSANQNNINTSGNGAKYQGFSNMMLDIGQGAQKPQPTMMTAQPAQQQYQAPQQPYVTPTQYGAGIQANMPIQQQQPIITPQVNNFPFTPGVQQIGQGTMPIVGLAPKPYMQQQQQLPQQQYLPQAQYGVGMQNNVLADVINRLNNQPPVSPIYGQGIQQQNIMQKII